MSIARNRIVRDPKGRAFEPNGMRRDGYSMRFPLYLKDGTPVDDGFSRAIVDSFKRRCDDTLVITTSAPPMIVDAFGGTEELNRPGARYLVAGHRTTVMPDW